MLKNNFVFILIFIPILFVQIGCMNGEIQKVSKNNLVGEYYRDNKFLQDKLIVFGDNTFVRTFTVKNGVDEVIKGNWEIIGSYEVIFRHENISQSSYWTYNKKSPYLCFDSDCDVKLVKQKDSKVISN